VADAYALLRASIEDPDPVLFFKHKFLYRRLKDSWDTAPTARLGEAALRKDGTKAAILTYGAMQHRALEAVADLDVAVMDLRTLAPLDLQAIETIAKRTHRILVLTEAQRTYGPGAEIAAHVSEANFPWLDAPVMRLGSADTPTPAASELEAEFLPGIEEIRAAVGKLLAY
jgi:pyruvate/2-oxoglutarate/acetoin dehydrogenase E1 component